jgi:hypothetical protein
MPESFPLETPENSGNMIHANAPFEMFGSNAFLWRGSAWKDLGYASFPDFVNERCSHLVVTLANTLRDAHPDGTKYANFQRFLENFRVPVVVFGFGVQAKHDNVKDLSFPPEAISMLRYIASHTTAFGVRGQFTADALAHHAGVTNTFVTGCPSLFSRPHALAELKKSWTIDGPGEIAYAGTNYNDPLEAKLLARAVENDWYLIEPVSKILYATSLGQSEQVPGGLRKLNIEQSKVVDYVRRRLHLFRRTEDWYEFNRTNVKATFGTRFHVNMASILSGKPALWLTHDSRTRELVEAMDLPSLPSTAMIDRAGVPPMDYSRFFDKIDGHFDRFNEYLSLNGLPSVPTIRDLEREAVPAGTAESAANPVSNLTAPSAETLSDTSADRTNDDNLPAPTQPALKDGQLQIATTTSPNRYPELFAFVSERLNGRARVLSFGCSAGDEVFTLAARYFDHSEIIGVDVNPEVLSIAAGRLRDRAYLQDHPIRFNWVSFEQNDGANPGRFDCVFAMSVLCRWPPPQDVLVEFPYATFVAALRQIDAAIKPGGYLVIYNTAYRFEDTTIARGYRAVHPPSIGKPPFVRMYRTDGTVDDGPSPAVVFRKHTLAYRIGRRLSTMFNNKRKKRRRSGAANSPRANKRRS